MSKIPLWLVLLVFVGYSVWAVRFWHCYVCKCCDGQPSQEVPAKTTGEPLFKWKSDVPEPDTNFAAWKKALLARGGQGDTLLITGWQRPGEPEGLGLARAEAIKRLMAPEVPDSRVRLASKTVQDELAEGSAPMRSADYEWIKMVLAMEKGAIIESDRDVIFLFPFRSTEYDKDPDVENYLKKLVEKHKTTTATFLVVGHTDDVGSDEYNVKLGYARAQSIANVLIRRGIAPSRIKVESRGKREPVADNTTEDGRHRNRRVVITVKP
ncbi:MAG: OmpA family protein [Saprospiraceae bacterium]|nr:OmpA family protein [Saprospiraceae bacterium]MDW8483226.1 OmpA family protein [Saprospiraceae bacterium]